MPFLLDTNAYFLFFQPRKKPEYASLIKRIKSESDVISFYISEITSLEIHSVMGKYRRDVRSQSHLCKREIVTDELEKECRNVWVKHGNGRTNWQLFHGMRKLVSDVEARRGNVQATILNLDTVAMREGRDLLLGYADRYNFGSHDALIAGTLIAAKQTKGIDLTLVTLDKGFKEVLRKKGVSVFDPLKDA